MWRIESYLHNQRYHDVANHGQGSVHEDGPSRNTGNETPCKFKGKGIETSQESVKAERELEASQSKAKNSEVSPQLIPSNMHLSSNSTRRDELRVWTL